MSSTDLGTKFNIEDRLYDLSSKIVNGATLEESLDYIFDTFEGLVPYERIGYAEIDENCESAHARWCRSRDRVLLRNGFTAPLAGSSLFIVLQHRQPRVLNNLPEYLKHRPNSRATQLIVREGIRSSMTCPLFVRGQPLGFLFFSSTKIDTYNDSHVRTLKEVAMQVALLLMASNNKVVEPPLASEDPVTGPEPQATEEPQELTILELGPGMVLAEAIKLDNGTLLLASDFVLTQTAVQRLVSLHSHGFMHVDKVHVHPVSAPRC